MAHEELMRELPKDIEEATEPGIFYLRNNLPAHDTSDGCGSYSIIVLTETLVSCGGKEAKERADQLASELNHAWNDHFERQKGRVPK